MQSIVPFNFDPTADQFEEHHLDYKETSGGALIKWPIIGATIFVPSHQWFPDFHDIEKANGGVVKFHGLMGFSVGSYLAHTMNS